MSSSEPKSFTWKQHCSAILVKHPAKKPLEQKNSPRSSLQARVVRTQSALSLGPSGAWEKSQASTDVKDSTVFTKQTEAQQSDGECEREGERGRVSDRANAGERRDELVVWRQVECGHFGRSEEE